MPLSAALIARGTVVLAEYSPQGTNFSSIARRLLDQIPTSPDSKKSYSYESNNFHYLVEGGITYICMSDQAMGYRVPYAFLFDLNNRFKSTFGQKVHSAGPMSMNDTFGRVLVERLVFFSNDKSVDKISKVKEDINEVKKTMSDNIEKVLERGDRIEMLVDKTDDLHTQAQSFKLKTTKLKKKLWWKNVKLCCCIITILVVILLIASFFVLDYFGVFKFLPNIFHRSDSGDSTDVTTNFHPTQYTTTPFSSQPTTNFQTSMGTTMSSQSSAGTTVSSQSSAGTTVSSQSLGTSHATSSTLEPWI